MTTDFTHVYEPGTTDWTVVLLHGTGGDEHDLVPLGRQLAPGAALLSPRGQVLEGSMPRFFRRLAVGQLDIPDLIERTDELAAWMRARTAEHGRDPERVVAAGLSNGANIAVSVLFRHPDLLRGAALLRPMLPYEPDAQPDLSGTDVLIASGTQDPFAPLDQVRRLAQILDDGGATVTAHVQEAGHGLTQQDLVDTATWFAALLA